MIEQVSNDFTKIIVGDGFELIGLSMEEYGTWADCRMPPVHRNTVGAFRCSGCGTISYLIEGDEEVTLDEKERAFCSTSCAIDFTQREERRASDEQWAEDIVNAVIGKK